MAKESKDPIRRGQLHFQALMYNRQTRVKGLRRNIASAHVEYFHQLGTRAKKEKHIKALFKAEKSISHR